MTREFASKTPVRWCPGCGDYAILATVQKTFAENGLDPDKTVVISGIGCASRFPYYMNTYGLHTIHGRATAVATGLALTRQDLNIWVVVGDGDGLSIGLGHLMHLLRRNLNIKILLFNNGIYGLTKGQYSPTSGIGQKSGTTPFGALEKPLDPVKMALAVGCSFVARSYDTNKKHLAKVITAAIAHQGSALIEIYQNCPVYNESIVTKLKDNTGNSRVLYLESGEVLKFADKNLVWNEGELELNDALDNNLIIHQPKIKSLLPYALANLEYNLGIIPLGIFCDYKAKTLEQKIKERDSKIPPTTVQAILATGKIVK